MSLERFLLHVSPRGRLERPELALAPGPAAIATTGDGSLADLYGYAWALAWVGHRTRLVLFRDDGAGGWSEVEPASPLPALTVPARHVSLAFDRSARPMIAWQATDGIRVRQWDPAGSEYVVRGPFEGADPCLVFDGLPRVSVGGSDVVLYHLSSDRSRVVARREVDLYATEYEVAELGRSDLYLDQVARVPYRVRLELANDRTDPDTGDLDRVRLESSLYPLAVGDELAAAAPAATTGAYESFVSRQQVADELAAAAPAATTGAYESFVSRQQVADELDAQPPTATTGAYETIMEVRAVGEALAAAAPTVTDGAHEQMYVHVQDADALDAQPPTPTKGEHRAV